MDQSGDLRETTRNALPHSSCQSCKSCLFFSMSSEADPMHNFLELRIVAQVTPSRLNFQKGHLRVALFNPAFQPADCLRTFAERVIEHRDVGRWNETVFFFGKLEEPVEQRAR